jgi:ParB-like chromosome segregation protein Spo0J
MSDLIKLDQIKHNPYQGREEYGDIETLARSIAVDDLQETPKARKNGKGYELKFGHRRVEAFRWLRENYQAQGLPNRFEGYSVVPLDIEELTDEQMFVGAVIENEHRKNLTPIEQARMMIAYRDQFKKTSAEVGEKFGVSGETVRGLIRLLDLPEPVQAKIETGEITQGQARKLLTIARVDEKEVERAAKRLEQGQKPDDVMEQAFRTENAVTMQFGWSNDGAPRGGVGLWPLAMQNFPMKYMPELTAADVAKALELDPAAADLRAKIEGYMRYLLDEQLDMVNEIERHPEDADLIERIAHLAKPPACTACVFHAVADRAHYCGFKACHARKKAAWIQQEMAKASKKLGIAIYDRQADGAATLPLEERSYNNTVYAQHVKMVANRHAGLRIAPHRNEYNTHKWTDSHWCRLVLVGKGAVDVKEKKAEAKSQEEEREEKRREEYALKSARREASQRFVREYAVKQFAILFVKFDNIPVLCALTRENRPRKGTKPADALATLRVALADSALDGVNGLDWDLEEKGPLAVAKFLQGVAAEWGVKLPADFLEAAKGFEPAVSSETGGKKGKKQ